MGKLRIISRNDQAFTDRIEAGRLLGEELIGFKDEKPVVLGILRGGIIVADEIAGILEADLDIVLSRKLGAPFYPELAIGAVSENGNLFLNKEIASQVGAQDSYVEKEKEIQLKEIERRKKRYRKILPKVPLKDRIVIITDDGVATGATLQSALWSARQEGAKRVIAALPVGPEDSLKKLAKDTEEMICLRVPDYFAAVGQFYLKFDQTEEEEVLKILNEEKKRRDAR